MKTSDTLSRQPCNSTVKKVLPALCLVACTALAQDAKVTSLMQEELTRTDGQEGKLIVVEYEPGGSSPVHRHNAYAFVYVLEGNLVMQVQGEEEVKLAPGQTFLETPGDVHLVSRNASATDPARFLVFLVKQQGAPVSMPVD